MTLDGERSLNLRAWPGSGEPLVLLHGLLSSSAAWSDVAGGITRPCYAPDLPGFGGSSSPTTARLAAYADDVIHGLRALGLETFSLVGHSFGGAVATAAAERHPRAVTRLVLCAPAGFGRLRVAELAALPLMRPRTADVAPHVQRRRLGPGTRMAIHAVAHSSRARDAFHRRVVDYDGPVAAVWGEGDGVIPASHLTRLTASLPQAEAYLYAGVGHYLHRERARDIARFLETARPTAMLRPAGPVAVQAAPRWRVDGERVIRRLTRSA